MIGYFNEEEPGNEDLEMNKDYKTGYKIKIIIFIQFITQDQI